MKGIMSVVELVIVAIILFTAFGILFPSPAYTNRWQESEIILKNRDLLITLDNTGDFYAKSFSSEEISKFVNLVLPEAGLFNWIEVDGAIKSKIVVACNCTAGQITSATAWLNRFRLNGRDIDVDVIPTDLENIKPSDALIIWDYKPLSAYITQLREYVSSGRGIVEIMDFRYSEGANPVDADVVQKEIFGLDWIGIKGDTADTDSFARKPENSRDVIYNPYKYFYHLPVPARAVDVTTVNECGAQLVPYGTFTIYQSSYKFWICNSTATWFDTNGDGVGDTFVKLKENFTIGGFNFFLSYIVPETKIGISFVPDYNFEDFGAYIAPPGEPSPPGEALGIYRIMHIEPIDGDTKKILLYALSTSPPVKYPIVILNKSTANVAWIADFTEGGVGDDERLLLSSLVFWSSSKKTRAIAGDIKFGYSTSYINVNNTDMFEVYRFDLGLGFPF